MPARRNRSNKKKTQKSWAWMGLTGLFLCSMVMTAWWVSNSARLRVRLISPDQEFHSVPIKNAASLDRG